MAKRSKRKRTPKQRSQGCGKRSGRRGHTQRLLIGLVVVAIVVGIGLYYRYSQQQQVAPQLQGAIDNHYTRGVVGAAVVVKEFSDYA